MERGSRGAWDPWVGFWPSVFWLWGKPSARLLPGCTGVTAAETAAPKISVCLLFIPPSPAEPTQLRERSRRLFLALQSLPGGAGVPAPSGDRQVPFPPPPELIPSRGRPRDPRCWPRRVWERSSSGDAPAPLRASLQDLAAPGSGCNAGGFWRGRRPGGAGHPAAPAKHPKGTRAGMGTGRDEEGAWGRAGEGEKPRLHSNRYSPRNGVLSASLLRVAINNSIFSFTHMNAAGRGSGRAQPPSVWGGGEGEGRAG